MPQITLTGPINKNGQYGFYNIAQLAELCKKYPNHTLIGKFEIEMSKSKNALLAKYNIEVIPEVQRAFFELGEIKNTRQVNEFLLNLCPITQEKSLSQLSYDEMVMFFDFVNNFSLEHLSLALTEHRTL